MEEEKFDCIVVGGGLSGCTAATVLARHNLKVLLVERGDWTGSKNVSGGVLWGPNVYEVFPELSTMQENAPFERIIVKRRLGVLDQGRLLSLDFHTDNFAKPPYNGISVLRSRFDKWLGEQVEAAMAASECAEQSFVATGIKVDALLQTDGRVCGIQAGTDTFEANCVILAEGVNSLLSRSIGLQNERVASNLVACGIKEVWELNREMLEERFGLTGMNGLAAEFLGATEGVEGGAFLYTNRQSISIGLVLSLSSLIQHKRTPLELLDKFKQHSAIAPLLKRAKMAEYAAHVAPSGDYRLLPKKLYGHGVLVCGDAAGLFTNTGRSIEGMNHAVESGKLAALTVVEACKNKNFTADFLSLYEKKLQDCFIWQDIHNFKGAYGFLHNPDMFSKYPPIINETAERAFTINGQAKQKTRNIILNAMSEFNVSWAEAAKMGLKGGWNL